MRNLEITVYDRDHALAVIKYLTNHEECSGFPKSLPRTASNAIEKYGSVTLFMNENGMVNMSTCSQGYPVFQVEYAVEVKRVVPPRKVIDIAGKTYWEDEVLELLEGKEIM